MKKSTLFHIWLRHWNKNNGLCLLFLFCTYLFAGLEARAQASSYMFTSNTGTYEETSGDATTLPTLLADTAISGVLEIGFDFVYEGNTYTQFKASSNGFISFNTSESSLTANSFSDANAASRPIIAPLWDDLDGNATGGSVASYELTGTSPNQVLTVEWRNWEWNWNSTNPVISFQVKLYETTNVIEFAYRQESGSVNAGSASIGIGSATGSGSGSFLNITNVDNLTVSSTTSTTDIATKPLTDQILTFTPPTCLAPTQLNAENLTADTADLFWTSDGSLFDLEWGAVGFVPGNGEGNQEYGLTSNTITVEGLTQATNYHYYVRQDCGSGDLSNWAGPFPFKTEQITATLPYNEDFEGINGWEFANGTQVNKWVVGDAAHNGAEKAMYISDNVNLSYAYNISGTQASHAYRNIEIPAGTQSLDLSFDWKAKGEGFTGTFYDYITVWVVPVSFNPVAGTEISVAPNRIRVARLNNVVDFTTANFVVDVSEFTEDTARLVFEWRNDYGGGTQPPGAIDNVSVGVTNCIPPSTLAVDEVGINTAELSWESDGTLFDVAWGAVGFTPEVDQEGIAQEVAMPHTLEGLTSAATYQYYVRQNCGDNTSIWIGPFTFTTLQVAATLPYSVDFETEPHNWTLSNINQTNKWVLGTAAHDGAGTALYISNDNGVTNAYAHTSSVVHAFREIEIPDGTTNVDLSFDWRGVGETCCDYIRAWIVPITFMPSTGTQIVAANGKQVGSNFNTSSSFTTYNNVVDLTDYAGQTVRLVFEWKNDGGTGTAPAGAIDNVSVSVTSCSPVTGLGADSVIANSAELSWTSDGNLFDIEYGLNGFALGTGTLIEGVTNSYVLENLNPSTNYQYYVRQNCGDEDVSVWSQPFAFKTTQILAVLPYTQNFEDDEHSWEFNNGTHVNRWYVGDAVNNGGDRAMYISNDNGVTNAYTMSTSVTHAFKDVQIPDNAQNIAISFDWRCVGEGTSPNYYDYFRVWVVPATFTPTNGNQVSTTNGMQIGSHFNGSGTFVQANFTLDASAYQGQVVRLVFEFRSDVNGGVQPPAAIDNISIIEANCLQPTALDAQEVTASSAELSWTSDGATFDVQWGPDGFVLGTGTTETAVSNPHTLDQLNDAVAYQYYVRQNCGADEASIWAGPFAFMTLQIPVSLPYSEDFETSEHGWSLQNGNQINKWYVGDAVEGMNTLFISNDAGATNTYATGSTSLTHAYRSIQIPEGTEELTLSFDWRAVGDSTDYLKAWIVPESLVIVPGSQIATGAGNIPVGETMNLSADFTVAEHTVNVTALAGQTARLVFEWRNDYLGGVQTPAAIDNVSIEIAELGVNNPQQELFKYYPNPVTDILNFSHNSAITAVTVFNVLGQQVIVKAINATSGQIDMSNLASGNYIVKVQTEGLTKTIKVVKQ